MAELYTLPPQLAYNRYTVTDAAQVAYPYTFLVLDASELAIYADNVLIGNYNLTGLGNVNGGNIVFTTPYGVGVVLVFLRVTALTQPALFNVGGVLPTATLQGALNRAVMQIQDIHETLQRIPTLAATVRDALRSLDFPQPAGGAPLIGWNATLDALTLYPNTITVQTISPAVGQVYGRTVVSMSVVAGETEMRSSAAQIANSKTLGVTLAVTTTFSTENGLTGFVVGEDNIIDRWSQAPVALTVGTLTGEGNFSAAPEVQVNSALPLVIRALGGTWGATGALVAVVHWRKLSNA